MTNVNGNIREWLDRQAPWIREAATRLSVRAELTADDVRDLVLLMETDAESVHAGVVPHFPTIG